MLDFRTAAGAEPVRECVPAQAARRAERLPKSRKRVGGCDRRKRPGGFGSRLPENRQPGPGFGGRLGAAGDKVVQPLETGRDSGEQTGRPLRTERRPVLRTARFDQHRGEPARPAAHLAHSLAPVRRSRLRAEVGIRTAEQRIPDGGVQPDGARVAGRRTAAHAADQQPHRPPGEQPQIGVLGETVRISCRIECFVGDPPGGLMVLAAARAGGRQREHHVGPERPDHADDFSERFLPVPLLEGLLDAERVAEVGDHPEVLLHRVEPVGGAEFLGPQDAQPVEELGSDLVLSAAAARQRQERDPGSQAPAQQGVERVVLVVGMRRDRQHRDAARDLAEGEPEPGGATVLGERPELGRRGDGAESDDCRCQQRQRSKRDASRRLSSCHCRALLGGSQEHVLLESPGAGRYAPGPVHECSREHRWIPLPTNLPLRAESSAPGGGSTRRC